MKKPVVVLCFILMLVVTQILPMQANAKSPSVVLQPVPNINLSQMTNGLQGDYFNSRELTNFTSFRTDKTINFNWGNIYRPISTLKHDHFSIRWTGYIVPTFTEVYTLTTKADDGVKLYLNDTLLISDWTIHGEKELATSVQLVAGQPYSIKLEYFQYNGPASVKLYWSSTSQRKEIVPESHLFTPKVDIARKGTGTGLVGNYYYGKNFDKFMKNKLDSTINLKLDSYEVMKLGSFSVKWDGRIQPLYSEVYTFKTLSDDGVRLWINNQLIINNWKDMSETETIGSIQLQAGQLYDIKIEYYEDGSGPAVMKLYWFSGHQPLEVIPRYQLYKPEPPKPGIGTGLRAEYFADKMLTQLKYTKVDTDINFDWGNRGLPVDGVSHNGFSVRWTGKLLPMYSESYTLKTISDDGIRLWVNGNLLIDEWNAHSAKQNSYKLELQAGVMYTIKIEYYQETGFARCELYWSSSSQKSEIIPQTQLFAN